MNSYIMNLKKKKKIYNKLLAEYHKLESKIKLMNQPVAE
jgi:hypothetical protein